MLLSENAAVYSPSTRPAECDHLVAQVARGTRTASVGARRPCAGTAAHSVARASRVVRSASCWAIHTSPPATTAARRSGSAMRASASARRGPLTCRPCERALPSSVEGGAQAGASSLGVSCPARRGLRAATSRFACRPRSRPTRRATPRRGSSSAARRSAACWSAGRARNASLTGRPAVRRGGRPRRRPPRTRARRFRVRGGVVGQPQRLRRRRSPLAGLAQLPHLGDELVEVPPEHLAPGHALGQFVPPSSTWSRIAAMLSRSTPMRLQRSRARCPRAGRRHRRRRGG